jgi:hypothetical protein
LALLFRTHDGAWGIRCARRSSRSGAGSLSERGAVDLFPGRGPPFQPAPEEEPGVCSSVSVPPCGALEETPALPLGAGTNRAPRPCSQAAAPTLACLWSAHPLCTPGSREDRGRRPRRLAACRAGAVARVSSKARRRMRVAKTLLGTGVFRPTRPDKLIRALSTASRRSSIPTVVSRAFSGIFASSAARGAASSAACARRPSGSEWSSTRGSPGFRRSRRAGGAPLASRSRPSRGSGAGRKPERKGGRS